MDHQEESGVGHCAIVKINCLKEGICKKKARRRSIRHFEDGISEGKNSTPWAPVLARRKQN